MSSNPEKGSSGDSDIEFEFYVGDQKHTLSPGKIILRTFDEGGGVYDHCVVELPDGQTKGFMPPDTLKEFLQSIGRIEHQETIDAETIDFYAAHQRAEMEKEPEEGI